MNQFERRVAELLADAWRARQNGDQAALMALTNAVLALDPGNAEAEAVRAGSARRRQMTLLFCDIVGSTALADSRDPEDTSRLLRTYRAMCADVVARHGGAIHDHQGDGMLVLFGYPEVREDDVQRAVRCGLALLDAARELDPVRVRAVVHTDLVVLDGAGVAGAAVNEAARMLPHVDPDTLVVSDATEVIIRGWFDTAPRGRVPLRGVSRPVELFTVLRERPAGRRERTATPGPFVGRAAELDRVAGAWRATTDGWRAAAVGQPAPPRPGLLVTGPAGIGKTRLLTEAARRLDATGSACQCSRYQRSTSLFPFRPLLERACGIEHDDDPPRRLGKLRAQLERAGGPTEDLPFLASALQIPPAGLTPRAEVDPSRLREIALQVAAGLLLAGVGRGIGAGPMLLQVDDVQWADRSTLDLILMLLLAPPPGLLILLAARDGFVPPWPPTAVSTLVLDRLTDAETSELADGLLAGSPLPAARRTELIDRCDGMPLYLEELVFTAEAVEQDRVVHRSIRTSEHHIPAALRDPLLARLFAGGIDLDLAQLAATIGRDVDRGLLRRTSGLAEPELAAALQGLAAADLIEPVTPDRVRFRHELVREVAYETQPRDVRRDRHGRIADQLVVDAAGGRSDADPLGFHLARAERHQEAIGVLVRAAQADQLLGAHAEATRRLTDALGLLDSMPGGPAREQAELGVRELRSFSAVMSAGYAAPEAAQDHHRCVALCELAGPGPELLPSLIRSWSYFTFRGDLREADRVNDRIEAAGGGVLSTLVAQAGRGVTDFFEGRFPAARKVLQAFVEHPWGHTAARPPAEWPLPNDPLAAGYGLLIPTLWILDESGVDAVREQALQRARSLEFPFGPFSVCFVHSLDAVTCRMAGGDAAAGRLGEELFELGELHGFPLWKLAGAIQRGLTAAHADQPGALAQLVEDISVWRFLLVSDLWSPYWLTELARVHARAGDVDAAVPALDEAMQVATGTGVMFYAAETLRLRGELRRAAGDPGGATDLAAALDTARRQGAVAFVARAERAVTG